MDSSSKARNSYIFGRIFPWCECYPQFFGKVGAGFAEFFGVTEFFGFVKFFGINEFSGFAKFSGSPEFHILSGV